MPRELSAHAQLAENIAELHEVSRKRKDLEKQEAALKDWFKAEAKGEDCEFHSGDLVVKVTTKSRESLDRVIVQGMLSRPKFESCLRTSLYVEVSLGKAAAPEKA